MIFRTTKEQQDEYFRIAQFNNSYGSRLLDYQDPCNDVDKLIFDEEPNYFRKGKAVDFMLTSKEDFYDFFAVMPGKIPGKAAPILMWTIEELTRNGEVIGDMEEYRNMIVMGCEPGNVTEEGFGGSWDADRKWKALDNADNRNYWALLRDSKDKVRLSFAEYEETKDMAARVMEKFPELFDGRYEEHPDVHIHFQLIIKDVEIRTSGIETVPCKGMIDIAVINLSDNNVWIGSHCISPETALVIDVKSSSKHPATWESFMKMRHVDRQISFYSKLLAEIEPVQVDAAMLFVSSFKNSNPVLAVLSIFDMDCAENGYSRKSESVATKDEIIFEIFNRVGNVRHGWRSYFSKYFAHKKTGVWGEEIAMNKNKYTITTNLNKKYGDATEIAEQLEHQEEGF